MAHRIAELIFKELEGRLSEQEKLELHAWTNESPSNKSLYIELSNPRLHSEDVGKFYTTKMEIFEQLGKTIPHLTNSRRAKFRRIYFARFAVAAMVLIALTISGYFLLNPKHPTGLKQNLSIVQAPHNDVEAPKGSRAILTIGNGSTIILDSVSNGALANQENGQIEKVGKNELSYAKLNASSEVFLHTIATGPGGFYQVDLPDGSKAWLNSGSSLQFPTAFVGGERKVTMTGEVYFEIEHNARMPFVVRAPDNTSIKVLGTRFNVMAYRDEPNSKTTLLQGAIVMQTERKEIKLKPGQEARITKASNPTEKIISLTDESDTEQAIAWLNGKFQFNIENIETVMRTLSRWYDIDVVYSGAIPKIKLSGTINRSVNLSNVLKMLEISGVKCTLKGRTITVF